MNLYNYFKEQKDIIVSYNEKYGLASVKYSNLGVDWSLPHRLEARGLVITKEGEIVGRPYGKFFNYRQLELYEGLPKEIRDLSEWKDGTFHVMDKADGSLVIAYTYKDKLFLSSSGQVESNHSLLFEKLLDTYPKETKERMLDIGRKLTLNLEYISPENQIVVAYSESKFLLHGARVTETGEYLNYKEIKALSEYLGIELIYFYDGIHTLQDLLSALNTLENAEGFVVWFDDGDFRLKFKTEEYLQLHGLFTPLMGRFKTPRYIDYLFDMLTNDNLDDYAARGSEIDNPDLKEVFSTILKVSTECYLQLDNEFKELIEYIKDNLEFVEDYKYEFHQDLINHGPQSILDEAAGHRIKSYLLKGKDLDLNDLLINDSRFRIPFKEYLRTKIFEIKTPWDL